MKKWTILLILNGSLLIGMEPNDENNNNKKILGLMFIPRDQKEVVAISANLIPSFSAKNNATKPIDVPFSIKVFITLKDLLRSSSKLRNNISKRKNLEGSKKDLRLHSKLYTSLTEHSLEKVKDLRELIRAGLFLEVNQPVLEACIRYYVEKKAEEEAENVNKKNKKEKKSKQEEEKEEELPKNLDALFHKWHFLCVNSDYSRETDDFCVSWSEIKFFKHEYLEDKFYHRAPFSNNSLSTNLSLAGFHLDSTQELKRELEKRKIFWDKVQRVDLMCNKLADISFLEEIEEHAKTIELSRNLFTSLNLRNFSKLTKLYVNNNQLTEIPFLGGCAALKKLWLNHNQIKEIKALDLLDLSSLEELQLGNNKITTIHPQALAGCFNLKVFVLSYNPIIKLDLDIPAQCQFFMERQMIRS